MSEDRAEGTGANTPEFGGMSEQEAEEDEMVTMLRTIGVKKIDAIEYAVKCITEKVKEVNLVSAEYEKELNNAKVSEKVRDRRRLKFQELYGTSITRYSDRVKSLNVKGMPALDMREMRQDGSKWDFTNMAHRHEVRKLVR